MSADVLFNRPWAITREALSQLVIAWQSDSWFDDEDDADPDYTVTDGIAMIRIGGVLTREPYWFGTTYGEIRGDVDDALANDDVRGVALVFDSPGGEAASEMLQTAEHLYGARSVKPMISIADDAMYSAAYHLGSASGPIVCNTLGGVGSIGCWTAHIDMSGMLDKHGVKVTYIYSGAKKVYGNPHQPLAEEARSDLQKQVDDVRHRFASDVVRFRQHAGVTLSQIYDTEAGIYRSQDAVPMLADAVGSVSDGVAMLRNALPGRTTYTLPSGTAARLPARQPRVIDAGSHKRALTAIEPTAELRVISAGFAQASGSAGSRRVSLLCAPYATTADLGNGLRERYARGCFDLSNDPRICWQHDERLVLARTSAGTADFFDAADGLHAEFEAPATTYGDDLLTLLRNGTLSQSSLAFWIVRSHFEGNVRVIDQALVREASIVAWGMYPSASATAAPAAHQLTTAALQARIAALPLAPQVVGLRQRIEAMRAK